MSSENRNLAWYKLMSIWQRSPILRFLDKSLWFRIIIAFVAAYLAILFINRIEFLNQNQNKNICQPKDSFVSCLTNEIGSVITASNIEGFSILVVAILYVIESRDRKRQTHYEAWQVIDNAAAAGVPTSYARFQALQDLNADGISLKRINIPGINLESISLPGAELNNADLRETILTEANLSRAKFIDAKLISADLRLADLRSADLSSAKLNGANLSEANLSEAILTEAVLNGAFLDFAVLKDAKLSGAILVNAVLTNVCLQNADLTGASLEGADLFNTTLQGANFQGAEGLTPQQILNACYWHEAKFSEEFEKELKPYRSYLQ